jgi:hypothetical protein
MTEDNKGPVPENENEPVDAADEAKRKRAWRWQVYGWSVVGVMILVIVLNFLGLFTPEMNKYVLGLIVVAYGVYIFFRRR